MGDQLFNARQLSESGRTTEHSDRYRTTDMFLQASATLEGKTALKILGLSEYYTLSFPWKHK